MRNCCNPRLRFKKADGTEYPDWEEKKLEDITSFIRNGFSYKEGNNKNFPVSRIETISDRVVNYNKIGYAEFVPEDYLLKTGDILFSNINSLEHIGKTAFYESKSKLYHGMNLICLRPSDINNRFLFYLLNTETVRKINHIHAKRAVSQCSISVSDIRSYKLQIPCLEEQEKIADCFSFFDNLISIYNEQLKTLQEQKKGIMQKIFSQEVRFKRDDGTDYPDWEEKKLGEVCNIYDGTHQTPNYTKTGIKFVSVENINDLYSSQKFISEEDFEKNYKIYPQKGDILMTRIGDIGTPALVSKDEKIAFYVSLALFKPNNIINPKFFVQVLQSNFVRQEFWIRTLHTAFPKKINKKDIGICKLFLPCLEEQEKIADCLSAFDEAIKIKKEQIKTAKDLKKGLLQQMFT